MKKRRCTHTNAQMFLLIFAKKERNIAKINQKPMKKIYVRNRKKQNGRSRDMSVTSVVYSFDF